MSINAEMNALLVNPFSEEEISIAAHSHGSLKSSGHEAKDNVNLAAANWFWWSDSTQGA